MILRIGIDESQSHETHKYFCTLSKDLGFTQAWKILIFICEHRNKGMRLKYTKRGCIVKTIVFLFNGMWHILQLCRYVCCFFLKTQRNTTEHNRMLIILNTGVKLKGCQKQLATLFPSAHVKIVLVCSAYFSHACQIRWDAYAVQPLIKNLSSRTTESTGRVKNKSKVQLINKKYSAGKKKIPKTR